MSHLGKLFAVLFRTYWNKLEVCVNSCFILDKLEVGGICSNTKQKNYFTALKWWRHLALSVWNPAHLLCTHFAIAITEDASLMFLQNLYFFYFMRVNMMHTLYTYWVLNRHIMHPSMVLGCVHYEMLPPCEISLNRACGLARRALLYLVLLLM